MRKITKPLKKKKLRWKKEETQKNEEINKLIV